MIPGFSQTSKIQKTKKQYLAGVAADKVVHCLVKAQAGHWWQYTVHDVVQQHRRGQFVVMMPVL